MKEGLTGEEKKAEEERRKLVAEAIRLDGRKKKFRKKQEGGSFVSFPYLFSLESSWGAASLVNARFRGTEAYTSASGDRPCHQSSSRSLIRYEAVDTHPTSFEPR